MPAEGVRFVVTPLIVILADSDSAELGARPGGAKLGELGQLFPRVEPKVAEGADA